MQFLVFMIPGLYQPKDGKQIAPDFKPDPEKMAAMGRFNDELRKSGALLSVEGLQPLTKGTRLAFAKGRPIVTDGPFIETKEVIGGFWMLEAPSQQHVVDWMKRCPAEEGDVIEIRGIFDLTEIRAKARGTRTS